MNHAPLINKKNAFTLTELLIVIGIVGVLAAIAIPMYKEYMSRTRVESLLADITAAQLIVHNQFGNDGNLYNINYLANTQDFTDITTNLNFSDMKVENGEIHITGDANKFYGRDVFVLLTPIINETTGSINSWHCSADAAIFDILPKHCQNTIDSCPAGEFSARCSSCTGNRIWNGTTCVCRTNSEYWDGTNCIKCENGKIWDGSNCVCPTNSRLVGEVCEQCPGNQIYSAGNCVCAAGYNWNGALCIKCQTGQVWNGTSLQCECPNPGEHWNGTSCVTCSGGTTWNNMTQACECRADQEWNGSACVCPASAPFEDNGYCRDCFGGETWDSTACVCVAPISEWNWSKGGCNCPGDGNWNGSSCITCTGGKIWDQATLTCVCPPLTWWYANGGYCKNCYTCGSQSCSTGSSCGIYYCTSYVVDGTHYCCANSAYGNPYCGTCDCNCDKWGCDTCSRSCWTSQ